MTETSRDVLTNIFIMISRTHRGCTYYAHTEEDLTKTIDRADFERSIFYRSRVYTYSCYARELDDNTIEFTQFFNNGETTSKSYFDSKKEFYKVD